MGSSKRVRAAHVAEVLKRERELAPELFRPHTDAEIREIAIALKRMNQVPHPQAQLPLDAAR